VTYHKHDYCKTIVAFHLQPCFSVTLVPMTYLIAECRVRKETVAGAGCLVMIIVDMV
jgi:hypothetical protein